MCADAPNLPPAEPHFAREEAIVTALVAARTCPLGAAMGGGWHRPNTGSAVHVLDLTIDRAQAIVRAWDAGYHRTALSMAELVGLGPRIEAFVAARAAGAPA